MPLRIAFDLDGVLADMESELVRQSELLFGEPMTRRLQQRAAAAGHTPPAGDAAPAPAESDPVPDAAPVVAQLNMTSRQQRRLWRHVESIENFWEGLAELEPGVIQRLAALASERRWEIIFLTKRPETAGATAQVQTQRWLESKGFTLPSVFVVQRSRGRIAAALGLDIVVDDRPENCLDVVVDSKARAILVWRGEASQPPAAAQRLGIGVVKSVAGCLEILAQIDSAPQDEPGVMSRVMRLLGLKEPVGR
jgi:phosphoglycolate phosphatase-like HAD superfamily hydrolase